MVEKGTRKRTTNNNELGMQVNHWHTAVEFCKDSMHVRCYCVFPFLSQSEHMSCGQARLAHQK
jgi:hypothetical protein